MQKKIKLIMRCAECLQVLGKCEVDPISDNGKIDLVFYCGQCSPFQKSRKIQETGMAITASTMDIPFIPPSPGEIKQLLDFSGHPQKMPTMDEYLDSLNQEKLQTKFEDILKENNLI